MDHQQNNRELAGRGARLGAAIIDGLILGVITVVPLMIMMGGFMAYSTKMAEHQFLYTPLLAVFGFVVYLLVNGYFLAQTGQSIGKKAVGIKIVRTDGSQPDLQHIAMRRLGPVYLVQCIPVIGGFGVLIDVLMIFRESRQCLHDSIADTIVVNA